MRPLQWWLKTKGFFLRGNPLRMIKVTWRCLHALDMWRQVWFLSQGPVLGPLCHRVMLARLGSGHGWTPCLRSVEWSPSHKAFQLPGDGGGVSGSKTLSPRPKKSPCVDAHQQHSGGLLHPPPRRSAVAPPVQASAPDPCVVPGQGPLAEVVYIPGHLNVGAHILSRQGPRPGEWVLHTKVVK